MVDYSDQMIFYTTTQFFTPLQKKKSKISPGNFSYKRFNDLTKLQQRRT